MQVIFSSSDVVEFIAQNNLGLWTGNIYDYKTNRLRSATKKDFDQENKSVTLELLALDDDKTLKDFNISNFEFSALKYDNLKRTNVTEKNLTTKWHDFMLKTYGDEYAEMLSTWSAQQIQTIDETISTKQKITAPTKAKFEKLRAAYEKILTKAKKKIKEKENQNRTALTT